MTKFAKKHLSRCVGLYLVGAVAIGAGVAVYDMPSAYAFSDSAYNTINANINDPSVGGFSIVKNENPVNPNQYYKVIFAQTDQDNVSPVYMSEDALKDSLELNRLDFDARGENSPLNIEPNGK